MKWQGRRRSSNVRRGSSRPTGSFRFPGAVGGSRGGRPMGGALPVGGVGGLLLVLLFMIFSGGLNGPSETPSQRETRGPVRRPAVESSEMVYKNEMEEFLAVVLADTEDVWHAVFKENGLKYREPTLVLYTDQTQTGCGIGSSRMGPFYCPADESVYIDPAFYIELKERFDAPGDFAFAYVLAHEVGHHVQNLLGITDEVFAMKSRMSEQRFNTEVLVRLELQADYFAGVFAHHVQNKGYLEAGDIEEAMNAAAAVGDDAIQKKMTGRVSPDNFTHGTSEQRMRWFNRGLKYGDLDHGDTFEADGNALQVPQDYASEYGPAGIPGRPRSSDSAPVYPAA